jgi:large subunit ribosomal protein L1
MCNRRIRMDKKKILEALKQAKSAGKRNFNQSVDLIINLRDLDLKKPEQQVDFFAHTHYPLGKKYKIAAFVGPELAGEAKKHVDTVITSDDFGKYKDKKAVKKLANAHDYFIAQADIMAKVAQSFGKILGTRGKMPNPKAGCVVPPKASLAPLYENLQKTVRIKAKTMPAVQCLVGKEDMDEEHIADNIHSIYNQLVHNLPNHENNIAKIMVKLTMGQVVEIK